MITIMQRHLATKSNAEAAGPVAHAGVAKSLSGNLHKKRHHVVKLLAPGGATSYSTFRRDNGPGHVGYS